MAHPRVPSLVVVQGPWTPLPLHPLLRALHPETLSSPACLRRYSPYTRRETPVIEFSRVEAYVLFRTSIVKKGGGLRRKQVTILPSASVYRMRLTGMVA